MKPAAATLLILGLCSQAVAQGGNCYPECRPGYVCSPSNECVSICNPPCGDAEVCTAEARCIADSNAAQRTPAPAPTPTEASPPPADPVPVAPYQPVVLDPSSGLAERGSFRLRATFDLGFAGAASLDSDFGDAEVDLGTTLGARIRAQIPVGSVLLVGASLGIDGLIADGAPSDTDRLKVLGVEGLLGASYGIDLGSIALEPFGFATIGLAVGLADDAVLEDSEVGLAFGVRAGVNLWFTPTIGATVDMGYQMHAFFLSDSGVDFTVKLQQFRFGLGGVFRFGA
ncbi:MAG: hypothetical protein AAF938_16465 [Myxococcota bacterium]